jgi:hypothetical protein
MARLPGSLPLPRVLGSVVPRTLHPRPARVTARLLLPTCMHFTALVGGTKKFGLIPPRGNPPFLHDQRLLTLDDTVELFNLILGTKLTAPEKQDLVEFMRAL